MRATIRDVAREAGVSTTTVSVVLNDRRDGIRVPEATRQRVLRAAEDLGYQPNILARSLRTRRTSTIGFVSDEVTTTPFAVSMLAAAQDEAARRGYLLLVVNLGANAPASVQAQAIEALHQQQVAGVVYACMYHRVITPPPGLPAGTVFLNAAAARGPFRSIVPDERQGARDGVRELIARGHRRIGFLDDHRHPPASLLRLDGMLDALREADMQLDPALHVETTPFVRGGLEITRLLDLPEGERPTGVFCFNDRMAMGAYRAARYRGRRIPEDLSIVGFDDQEYIASELDPGLTTLRLPHREMGELAVRMLLGDDVPEAAAAQDGLVKVPCTLVRRESVAAPAGF